MRAPLVLALLLACAATARADAPVPLGPCGPIERRFDPIELEAGRLHRLGGTAIARLGVLAFRGGTAAPIPFQVDERVGHKLALPGGPEGSRDDKPGTLDADDLLVFMACDAGEAAPRDAVERALADAGTVSAWRELRIDDPVRHTAGFVYVVAAERPPATDRRYVGYQADVDIVSSARYRIGLVHALPNYFALALAGPFGPNLLDGLRLRAEATLRANLAHWTLNEQQGRHQRIAWTAGPVRVVRRSRHQVSLGFGIHLTAGVAHTYFYPQHVFGPGSLKLPFSPGVFFKDITARGGAAARDLRGWRYHADGVPPKGFLVDGHMDDAERAFDGRGEWFALGHRDEAILFVTHLSENLRAHTDLRLLYLDDAKRLAPPEDVPGSVPFVGSESRHVEKLPAGRYRFQLVIYMLPGYRRGNERPLLADLDGPLGAEVTAEGPGTPAAAPAAPR